MKLDSIFQGRVFYMVCLVTAAALWAAGCDDNGKSEADDGAVDDLPDATEDPGTPDETDVPDGDDLDAVELEDVEPDTVETVDGIEDGDADEDVTTGSHLLGTEIVHVKNGETITDVELSTLDHTEFDGNEAVRIQLIIDEASLDSPYAVLFNFIGSDGYDVLVDRLEGDVSGIPLYPETTGGFLYQDPAGEDGLVAGWDAALAMPRYMNVKQMDGGTIEAVPFPDSTVLVICLPESIRAGVDLSTMTTTAFVDPHHPELGEQDVVPLEDVITAAALASASTYGYKLTGSDGYENTDASLIPYENLTHAYIHPTSRNVMLEEAYDTPPEGSWRIRETLVIRAKP